MARLKVVLLTGRSLLQGIGKEHGKTSERYVGGTSVCELHPKDLEGLGLRAGTPIRVTTEFGSIVVKGTSSPNIPRPGIIFIPYGPYASMLMNASTDSTGMPTFKGLDAEVEPAPGEEILGVRQLLKEYLER